MLYLCYLYIDAQPTLTVLIRGSFGRQAWTLQLRHLPRHRSSSTKQYNVCPGRPVAMEEPGRYRHTRKSTIHFSESIERVPTCKMYFYLYKYSIKIIFNNSIFIVKTMNTEINPYQVWIV